MIETRLTRRMGLDHPVILAPMAGVAGGRLAAAVNRAGGLGLIGGGYCDAAWIDAQFGEAGNAAVGCGFITWRLAGAPEVLDHVLERKPRAVLLSFGEVAPFAEKIRAAGVTLICQVQSRADAEVALEEGAEVIVAQGGEAGGHGARRATMTLVPEVADLLAAKGSDALLVAAGGIADGRGLAAALMLGADGVMLGTRLWASAEALVPEGQIEAAMQASGDATLRTRAVDVVRDLPWPEPYDIRVLGNRFTERWHGDLEGLRAARATEGPRWQAAFAAGDAETGNPVVGEAIGLIRSRPPAAAVIETLVRDARALLDGGWRR
ncbi:NAD(P)H-dependent flavin oxidoreductase [Marinibacterium profundimaris]|uniref:Oxidoreductase n=1 Tax=Marinibacterium profundimaris TaxID=1679460 RepID=A0A225NSM1_9RHOB|nr:nitronate monooxygenase [Marinibacterium profundimaris]OWU77911.1 oxidoreductase [Marinibacterium profundimaris]